MIAQHSQNKAARQNTQHYCFGLEICGRTGIEAMLLQAQLRLVGHVVRMLDTRIPTQFLRTGDGQSMP